MSGRTERTYPWLGGLIGIFVYLGAQRYLRIAEDPKDLLSTAINVSTITIGFLATMKSILLMMDRKRAVQQLKDMGKFNTLIEYTMHAISLCFVTAMASGAALFLLPHKTDAWYSFIMAAWVGIIISTALSCYRAISILSEILKD